MISRPKFTIFFIDGNKIDVIYPNSFVNFYRCVYEASFNGGTFLIEGDISIIYNLNNISRIMEVIEK